MMVTANAILTKQDHCILVYKKLVGERWQAYFFW
jgi:hypothetical protein